MNSEEVTKLLREMRSIEDQIVAVLYGDNRDRWVVRPGLPDEARQLLVRMLYDCQQVRWILIEEDN